MKGIHSKRTDIVQFAEEQAKLLGQRWTPIRMRVFKTLVELDKPVTAYQLLEEVARRYDRDVQPPSIYRSLEALMRIGVVAKIGSSHCFIVCEPKKSDQQKILLLCDHCGTIDMISDQGTSNLLLQDAERKGFQAARQKLVMHGDCKRCKDTHFNKQ